MGVRLDSGLVLFRCWVTDQRVNTTQEQHVCTVCGRFMFSVTWGADWGGNSSVNELQEYNLDD